MKKLIWKELVEMRFMPLTCAVLMALALAIKYWSALYFNPFGVDDLDMTNVLLTGITLSGVLPGSSAIAGEVSSGTLKFLTTLPTSRLWLWSAKVIAGLITTLFSGLFMAISWAAAESAAIGWRRALAAFHFWEWAPADHVLRQAAFLALCTFVLGVLTVYAVSLLVSTLTDSKLTATILALIASLGVAAIVLDLGAFLRLDTHIGDAVWWFALLAILMPACLLASCVSFRSGEAMRTRKKFILAFSVLGLWLSVSSVGVAVYSASHPYRNRAASISARFHATIGKTYQRNVVQELSSTDPRLSLMAEAHDPAIRITSATVIYRFGMDFARIAYDYTPKYPVGEDRIDIQLTDGDSGQHVGDVILGVSKNKPDPSLPLPVLQRFGWSTELDPSPKVNAGRGFSSAGAIDIPYLVLNPTLPITARPDSKDIYNCSVTPENAGVSPAATVSYSYRPAGKLGHEDHAITLFAGDGEAIGKIIISINKFAPGHSHREKTR